MLSMSFLMILAFHPISPISSSLGHGLLSSGWYRSGLLVQKWTSAPLDILTLLFRVMYAVNGCHHYQIGPYAGSAMAHHGQTSLCAILCLRFNISVR